MDVTDKKPYARIEFEDNGQDFLWWIIDKEGLVIGAGPFQAGIWIGNEVELELLAEGICPLFASKYDEQPQPMRELKHQVERIKYFDNAGN